MALIRRRTSPALDAAKAGVFAAGMTGALVVVMAAGCSAGPATGKRAMPAKATSAKSGPAAAPAAAPSTAPAAAQAPKVKAQEVSRPTPASDWQSFPHTSAALRADIAARAEALKKGPIGNRAAELASLRLAASARDLLEAGSPGGALEALHRALSLYGGNGYAYLYLAYVNHVEGRQRQAAEFAANARRYLPHDKAVEAELEDLRDAIGQRANAAGT